MSQPLKLLKFSRFWGQSFVKLLITLTYVCEKDNNFQDSKLIFVISDFKIFPLMLFETAEFWCIVGLTAILGLLKRKFHFSVICSFYCCLVKKVTQQFVIQGLVSYKPFAFKKTSKFDWTPANIRTEKFISALIWACQALI